MVENKQKDITKLVILLLVESPRPWESVGILGLLKLHQITLAWSISTSGSENGVPPGILWSREFLRYEMHLLAYTVHGIPHCQTHPTEIFSWLSISLKYNIYIYIYIIIYIYIYPILSALKIYSILCWLHRVISWNPHISTPLATSEEFLLHLGRYTAGLVEISRPWRRRFGVRPKQSAQGGKQLVL